MRYNKFGTTGLTVSSIGFGGAQYHYDAGLGREHFVSMIQHAYDIGIRLFDTSPYYESEAVFGEALNKFDRKSFVLNTKLGRYHRPGSTPLLDLTAKNAEESVRRSLRLLQTDYIDTIQIHELEYACEGAVEIILTETLPALEKLREKGLVKFIGLASYHLPKMKEIIERSSVKIDSVLNHSCLTLIDCELVDYMHFFNERGIAVINASALAHGLLSSKPLPYFVTASDALKRASQEAVRLCNDAKLVIERLAIGWTSREGERLGVASLLTGPVSVEQFDNNVSIVENGLTDEEWAMCERLGRDVFGPLKQKDRNWVENDIRGPMAIKATDRH